MRAYHRVTAGKKETLSLSNAAHFLLEECRMVLPGIQALFGFQLVAVFSQAFSEKLTATEQQLHLAAIALVAIAIALIMTPAAYHRQAAPDEITDAFIRLSTRMLLWSMWPLMLGICAEFYLVARVLAGPTAAPLLSAGLLLLFLLLWFVLPRTRFLQEITMENPESR